MSTVNKTLSLIGFATKARKILFGAELTVKAVRKGKNSGVYLMLYASDASDNTKKRITDCGAFHNVPAIMLEQTSAELSKLTGKLHAVAVMGIADEGFAKAIMKSLSDVEVRGE